MAKVTLPKLIGVIHLPPLPGSPLAAKLSPPEALQRAGLWAVNEARLLTKLGFHGLIIENFGDAPFYKTEVPAETIAAMAMISAAIKESSPLPLGINVLRNDAKSALSIAAVTGADFIRVNVLSGVVATDQGLIEGQAATLIRERIRLNATHVKILADVHVKHAKTLSSSDVKLAIEETAGRGGADAVIISGGTTGRAPERSHIEESFQTAKHVGVPLYIGSGMNATNLSHLPSKTIGAIVGSDLRVGGQAGQPLDKKRIQAFLKAWNKRA